MNTVLSDNYFGLIRNLSPEIKLDIIEKLSITLKSDFSREKSSFVNTFGAWKSNKTAEEIIDELKEHRTFNREIEPLI